MSTEEMKDFHYFAVDRDDVTRISVLKEDRIDFDTGDMHSQLVPLVRPRPEGCPGVCIGDVRNAWRTCDMVIGTRCQHMVPGYMRGGLDVGAIHCDLPGSAEVDTYPCLVTYLNKTL